MKTLKENVFNIIISFLLTGILATLLAIYSDWKSLPEKWDDNKNQHERFDELHQQEIDQINDLKVRVKVLENEHER